MNTSPYQAPQFGDDEIRSAKPPKIEKQFFRSPAVIEWIVIVGVVVVIIALLPNVDEGTKEPVNDLAGKRRSFRASGGH